jgi:Spy/CpxP family protein refolding chaperone
MKITLVTAGALALGLLAPLSVSAQQAQPQPGYQARQHTTPDEPTMQHRWQKRLGGLDLSGDQQQRISSIIHGYAQSHPAGSPPDRAGNRALRQQILSVLSPDQRQQYHQMVQQQRAAMQQRHEQMNGQGQQGPSPQYGDPRDQQQGPGPDQGQGPPPDQGQGPPPDYQGQGPPPDQQGPPPDQGQGPPPDQQGPPPDQGQGPPPA